MDATEPIPAHARSGFDRGAVRGNLAHRAAVGLGARAARGRLRTGRLDSLAEAMFEEITFFPNPVRNAGGSHQGPAPVIACSRAPLLRSNTLENQISSLARLDDRQCRDTNIPTHVPRQNYRQPCAAANVGQHAPLPLRKYDRLGSSVEDKGQKTSVCDEYDVEEDPDTNSVKFVSGGQVLHTIKLLTDRERNGFAFDGVKKTQEGFELAIEYGTRIFYRKNFSETMA